MIVRIDFNSDEALYMQLYNQIIIGRANSDISEGENLLKWDKRIARTR